MEINTLVTHKKLKLGIGCILKVLSKSVKVNFGVFDTKTCKVDQLKVVDTSNCKTVISHEYSSRILKDKSDLNDVIVGNKLKHYVGIGWITTRVITIEDLKHYPRVI